MSQPGRSPPVYHGEHGTRGLKELVRSYEYPVEDSTRVMNRIKALYRRQRPPATHGLRTSHHRTLKYVFKGAALDGLAVRALRVVVRGAAGEGALDCSARRVDALREAARPRVRRAR